ncbi:MAG: hypothetical protein BWY22_01574 [Bacteroidetes bacterium ADurb.Bin217]|nr:MAG: hypothetical protein BWY22_01574 [Bacteroidetes bacterium ADurb.Bin217]
MQKKTNYFKAFGLLVLLTAPNFASNTFRFQTSFDPNKHDVYIHELEFISKKKLFTHIAKIESRGAYNVVSEKSMLGKYQASKHTLRDFGYSDAQIDSIYTSVYEITIRGNRKRYFFDTELFPPSEQERFIRWYTNRMERILLKYHINEYVGKTIDGVFITKAGLLHASMLGHTHVIRFLETQGAVNYTPKRGYSVKERLQQLENFELH